MTTSQFSSYALIWYNKYQKERQRNEEPMTDTWDEMRSITRKIYVPTSYNIDLQFKLQKLTQGNKS